MFSIFVAAQSGTNLVHDNGYIGNGLVGSLDMLVMCDECISMVNQYMKGMEVSPETLALDLVHQAGPAGDYRGLSKNMARWTPRYLNKMSFENWSRDPQTMGDKMKEQIDGILKNHKPVTVTEHVSEEFKRIIAEHEKKGCP